MPKDDDLSRRIEAVFESTGLGNFDPEKLVQFLEMYEQAMATAARVRNRKGKKFGEVLATTEPKLPEEES